MIGVIGALRQPIRGAATPMGSSDSRIRLTAAHRGAITLSPNAIPERVGTGRSNDGTPDTTLDSPTKKDTMMLTASRGLALATIAAIVVLFVTAGPLVQRHEFESIHGTAAIALHVFTGLLTLTLAVLARARQRGWWAAGVAAATFAYSFLQANLGSSSTMDLHIPGALVATAATLWLTFWVFQQPRSVATRT